jgi:hypothetical protein
MTRRQRNISIAVLLLIIGIGPPVRGQNASSPSDVGAAIDLEPFRFSRKIAPGQTRFAVLPLDAAVLAHSRLDDIRIVSPDGHQIPYIMEKASEPLSLPLPSLEKTSDPRPSLMKDRTEGSVSCYCLRLPYSNLPPASLIFTTSARVFHRTLNLVTEEDPYDKRGRRLWTHSVAEGTWDHADPKNAAPSLTLSIPSLRTTEVLVVVEEGDNSPLPIASPRMLLPAYRLQFFRGNRTDLKLYYGRNDLQAPHYDIEILGPSVMDEPGEYASMGPEIPAVSTKTPWLPHGLFWGILIAAVLALLALVVRLARQAKGESA